MTLISVFNFKFSSFSSLTYLISPPIFDWYSLIYECISPNFFLIKSKSFENCKTASDWWIFSLTCKLSNYFCSDPFLLNDFSKVACMLWLWRSSRFDKTLVDLFLLKLVCGLVQFLKVSYRAFFKLLSFWCKMKRRLRSCYEFYFFNWICIGFDFLWSIVRVTSDGSRWSTIKELFVPPGPQPENLGIIFGIFLFCLFVFLRE